MEEINIYCDESCHLWHIDDQYMALGLVACPKIKIKTVNKYLGMLKREHNIKTETELKWTKLSNSNHGAYKDIINYFFDNDYLKFRCVIINKQEIRLDFDEDGKLVSESNFAKDVLSGEYKEFYDSGKVKSTANYTNGVLEGLTLVYDEEGNLSYEIPYVKNRKEGKVKRYYPTGELMGEVSYEKGKKHGMLDAYNPDGTLMAKVLFNKDEAIKGYSLNHGKDPVLMSDDELKLINEAY